MQKRIVAIAAVCLSVAVNAGLLNQISCPDCGKTVSTRAALCPHCGCGAAAIKQAADAGENAALLFNKEQLDVLMGSAQFGQVGRIMFLKNKNLARDVITNGVDAFDFPSALIKKQAAESVKKIVIIEKLGFTFDQIYTMRMDMVQPLLQATPKKRRHPVEEVDAVFEVEGTP